MTTENAVRACRPSVEHPVAIVLGSGLGHLSGLVKPVRRIAYETIEDFPATARPVSGHSFEATVGTIERVPVVVYPGRVHLYQGYSAYEVSSLVRHAHRLGCRVILFACATGAVRGVAQPGLGLISDHVNLTGANPLIGWSGEQASPALASAPFVDMSDAYDSYLRRLARDVASDSGIELGEGVCAGVVGPTFETGAEAKVLAALGISYVGMSLVCETIMARALGMRVLGITLASNFAGDPGVSHQSVLSSAHDHADEFEQLVCGVLRSL